MMKWRTAVSYTHLFGADNVISAVMHADEINVAASEELGKEIYHYHLHAMVLPVVEKEIPVSYTHLDVYKRQVRIVAEE